MQQKDVVVFMDGATLRTHFTCHSQTSFPEPSVLIMSALHKS